MQRWIPILIVLGGCSASTPPAEDPGSASGAPSPFETHQSSARAQTRRGYEPAASPPDLGVAPAPAEQIVEMTVHVMSKCPYAVKVLDAVVPVARELGDRFKLHLEYIGRDEDGELTSMHGPDEVSGDKLQICVHQHGSYGAWLTFLECQNESWRSIPEGWERCAQGAQVDVERVRRCYQGQEGNDLLRRSFQVSTEAGARGSPTIYIDGTLYRGGRSDYAFSHGICQTYEEPVPPYCEQLQPPPAIPIVALVSSRCDCEECDVERQLSGLKSRILGAKVDTVDYDTPRGRELFEAAELKMLPAILVGREIRQDSDAMRAIRGYKLVGDLFVERVGRFDPVKGACVPRPEVPVRFLTDERCETRDCGSLGRFEAFIKRQVPRAKITTIDYGSPEGRTLWQKLSATWNDAPPQVPRLRDMPLGLPVALFGKSIEQEEDAFSRLERRFRVVGNEYAYQLGEWDPTAEICDNRRDDDRDRRVDCRDPDCRGTKVCRPVRPRRLHVFVMSQCPYGVQVLNAMEEVLDNFGRNRNRIDFRIEFIGEVGDDGELSSMHGQAEVEEDLRMVCAQHYYRRRFAFMDYVLCRNQNIRSYDWEQCATGPIKADVIRRCAEGEEGRRLLRRSFELAQRLDIDGSPTWMLNNRYDMRARTPEDIKNEYCERNQLPECRNTLSKERNARPRSSGGG